MGKAFLVRIEDSKKSDARPVRQQTLNLSIGLLVAVAACVLPVFTLRDSQTDTQKKLGYAFQLRSPDNHKRYLDALANDDSNALEVARRCYLEQDYQAALSHLRRIQDQNNDGGCVPSADSEEVAGLRKTLEQDFLYSLPWPEKVVAWLAVEMDGEKDHILTRVVDSGVGAGLRPLRLEILGWRSQRYRPLEPESFSLDGQPHREPVVPIRNLVALSSVNLYRPKEGSKGQIFISYLTDRQDYVAEIYLLKDGHIHRYRWTSPRPITVSQDHLEVYNSEQKKTECWCMRVDKWQSNEPSKPAP